MTERVDAGDVRELMGLHSAAARILVGWFVLTYGVLAATTAEPGGLLFELAGWALVSIAAVGVITAVGDPLPLGWTAFMTAAGPGATLLVLSTLPATPGALQLWPLSASTAVATYMCVRGRTLCGWASMILAIAVTMVWASVSGQGAGYGFTVSLINLAPLVMATFFAWTIRPAARDIFLLRLQGTQRAAAEAAHRAVLDERDRQLVGLDTLARPLLERLTDPSALSDEERRACGLLEAQLRDSLRARSLAVPVVTEAARSARGRGVDVMLLDDHGLDNAPADTVDRIVGTVAESLDSTESGTLTIRILPPGREWLMTVVQSAGDVIDRRVYDSDGLLGHVS
ncbi:hypothetical protein nbrc107696_11680 [Gordonia spumicola]|uniref:Uncharacterized protein n=1 Tax=Gordonia spumicola TaxID=589161 RepID=A0A7I9V696_9ACTN|nr:hypothetical protein [Gordonia spumicola]GEE00722.1 hypothetical protein nbrc107696_11680 [Gordonia spumicola]